MPCLLVLVAPLVPRVLIAGLFTTLLWYSAVQRWFGGEWGLLPIVGLVVALVSDSSPASGRRERQ